MKDKFHMTRWILLLWMAAWTLSCSMNEEMENETVEVRFKAALPEEMKTRGYGDATPVDVVYVSVLDTACHVIKDKEKFDVIDGSAEVSFSLAKGCYHFIFWAQHSDCSLYDITDLKSISVRTTELATISSFADAEKTDAFYAVKKYVNVATDIPAYDIKMKRPLCQVNVGTSGHAVDAKFQIKAPTLLSPLSEEVDQTKEWNYTFDNTNALPTDTFHVNGFVFNRLALCYVLAPDSLMFTSGKVFIGSNEKEFETIRIRANRKSNIIGPFTGATP